MIAPNLYSKRIQAKIYECMQMPCHDFSKLNKISKTVLNNKLNIYTQNKLNLAFKHFPNNFYTQNRPTNVSA